MTNLAVLRSYATLTCGYGVGAGQTLSNATTYYFGDMYGVSNPTTADDDTAFPTATLKAGIVRGISYFIRTTVAGTAGNVAVSVRVNNSTDISIGNVVMNAGTVSGTLAIAGTAVAAADKLKIKMVTPTWTTPPTGTFFRVWIWVEPTE